MAQSLPVRICMDTSLACDLYLYNDYDDLDEFELDVIAQLSAAKMPLTLPADPPLVLDQVAARHANPCTQPAVQVVPIDMGRRIQLECAVCLDAVQVPTATTCGHIYCRTCIVESLHVRKKCPMCMTKLTFRNIHPLYFN
ncbi:hypothetical protein H310_06346 [Aphanomyces invadans]|uniref:RING-type domain-containing protein n=1 Tax=Aphanomyces invadans TaxID=157072 RepID=A0A024U5P7_9STRA|nr:hypothetical protein H310_06346 [Aphanomyces invadans]ETW01741.1 hypothetical protein H310_06346 [Aphanomyces invadans]|eukprot:XP_008869589.1 hypothetical protein H310_06346 [Aphanomyces invadans]